MLVKGALAGGRNGDKREQSKEDLMGVKMVREAMTQDLPVILGIYENARRFMADNGNPSQWKDGFPPESLLCEDISKRRLYVLEREGKICGAFAFIIGEDPTYRSIEEGHWMSNERYGTIHRLAKDGTERGIFSECLAYCEGIIQHLRIDTHEKNRVMQRLIEAHGFCRCGIIHVADGSPRIAYEKTASLP